MSSALSILAAAAVLCVAVLLVVARDSILRRGEFAPHFDDAYFVPPAGSFRLLDEAAQYKLSLVIPAYNEEERLPIMLEEAVSFLRAKKRLQETEILVVDDGSADATSKVVVEYGKSNKDVTIRALKLKQNGGKGFAVKSGAMASLGETILMVDADGATKFSELESLEKSLSGIKSGAVFGSRNHLVQAAKAKRTFIRNVLMHGFHFIVKLLIGDEIKDTQCGFKLFSRDAARKVFPNLHIPRWGFDIEMLVLLQMQNLKVAEEAVDWTEIPGSKLSVAQATISMLMDILQVRSFYSLGIWRVNYNITENAVKKEL